MSSKRTVLYLAGHSYFLSGFRESGTHIRGWVENGHWSLYIVKETEECWKAFEGTSKNNLRDILAKDIKQHDPKTIERVEVPSNILGDYNVIIKWADARKGGAHVEGS